MYGNLEISGDFWQNNRMTWNFAKLDASLFTSILNSTSDWKIMVNSWRLKT